MWKDRAQKKWRTPAAEVSGNAGNPPAILWEAQAARLTYPAMHAAAYTMTTGNAVQNELASQAQMPANVLRQNAIRLSADADAEGFKRH